ncbi:MAG TPA: histidine phosphatase family protein [bacterium]|nr:histidine phosphatase family protein [bacterium]HOD86821.1 histidine phosphatase family protein [bacterium]HPW05411.1 histidine phosphatase family protein [bacterium]HQL34823.1 histidine phosphatase family protein [bacterium]HQQ38249.1 histidine phosphatase family protein [bacterium]
MMKKNPYARLQPKTREPYTVIYLVRHANPDYRLEKKLGDRLMPLSKEGKLQASFLAKRLLKLDLDTVYASSLARAQETASIFANRRKKRPIIIDERLDEIDWKNWHRVKYFRTSEERRKQYLPNYHVLDKQLDKMQARTRRFLAEVLAEHRGQRVALFCHGNIIKTFLTGIMNADVLGFLSLEIYQASISKLVIDGDGYVKIAYINDINHLPNPPLEDIFITLVS